MRLSPLILFLALLVLASCAEPAVKTYSYTPIETPGGRLCTGQCGEARDYCRQGCDLDNRTCADHVQRQAIDDYDKYTLEQFAAHQPIELFPRDFERMEPCVDAKKGCVGHCEDHYKSCYENCGGKVETTTSCQFLCY